MTFHRLQDTDAFILIEFSRSVNHLRNLPLSVEVKLLVGGSAKPFFNRLLANGTDRITAARMLQETFTAK
jgi:hypothetical protein